MKLDNGGNPADWFLMAAIDHHLGNDKDAQSWYERAVQWLRQSPAVDGQGAELRRLHEEAIRALGLPVSTIDQRGEGGVIEAMNGRTPRVEPVAYRSIPVLEDPR